MEAQASLDLPLSDVCYLNDLVYIITNYYDIKFVEVLRYTKTELYI